MAHFEMLGIFHSGILTNNLLFEKQLFVVLSRVKNKLKDFLLHFIVLYIHLHKHYYVYYWEALFRTKKPTN